MAYSMLYHQPHMMPPPFFMPPQSGAQQVAHNYENPEMMAGMNSALPPAMPQDAEHLQTNAQSQQQGWNQQQYYGYEYSHPQYAQYYGSGVPGH